MASVFRHYSVLSYSMALNGFLMRKLGFRIFSGKLVHFNFWKFAMTQNCQLFILKTQNGFSKSCILLYSYLTMVLIGEMYKNMDTLELVRSMQGMDLSI